jgi:DNA-binding NarL/FixJ family response regulator
MKIGKDCWGKIPPNPLFSKERFEKRASATLPKERATSARRAIPDQYGGLTERELEVATQVGQGKSNSEIAAALVVSKRTVET